MSERDIPTFQDFTRWVTARLNAGSLKSVSPDVLAAAAAARDSHLALVRDARDEVARTVRRYRAEDLILLAAADSDEAKRPTQLTTRSGFGLWLLYDEADAAAGGEITVLVRCLKQELIARMQGATVFLRSGSERYESSPFNPQGEALISVPASIEVREGLVFEAPEE